MADNSIDNIQIEITHSSNEAVKGIDNLKASLERLKGVTGGLTKSLEKVDFTQFETQMKKLSKSLQPLQGFKTQVGSVISSLRHFSETAAEINSFNEFGKFGDQMKNLAQSLEPLANIHTKLGATLKALNQVSVIGEQLDAVDFGNFEEKIATLGLALLPLGEIKSKLGSTLNQLSRIGQVSQQLDEALATPTLSENLKKLVGALAALGGIDKSNLSSTINALAKIPKVAEGLDGLDWEKFSTHIIKAADAMRPLATEMEKVAQGFSAFPARIQRLITMNERLTGSNSKLNQSYGILGTGISRTQLRMGAAYMVTKRLAGIFADWVVESNKYIENMNLFQVSMRGAADAAFDYAQQVHKAFGIDPSEWMRFQGVFMNMATGFGIASDQAAHMSKILTQLGYDLATLFNVDYEVAMQKLQSALAGQPRPMREWGFDMSEATLKLAAMQHGIEGNVETMTQMEKAQIRLLQIMDTASKQGVLGNFAREIYTPANAMRILQQQLILLRRELGNMFIPLLMKILPYLQAVVIVITDIARAIAQFLGFELPTIDYSGLGDMLPDLDDLGAGLDSADSSAKKLRKTLMGFDELNILSKQSAGKGGAGVGGGIGDLGIDFSLYDYDFLGGISHKANEIADEIRKKIEPLINFVRDNFDTISTVAKIIGTTLLAWKIAEGVLTFFNFLKEHKMSVGIALIITGFVLGVEGMKNIFMGDADVMDYIKAALGSALALSGALIAFGTGPAGWTIGIAAVIAITVTGFILASQENLKNLVNDLAYGNSGTLITDIADAFSKAISEVTTGMGNLIESGAEIAQHNKNIESVTKELDALFYVLGEGAEITEETTTRIYESLSFLIDEIKTKRDIAYDSIISELVASMEDASKTSKEKTQSIIEDLITLRHEGNQEMIEAQKQLNQLTQDYNNNKISVDEYIAKTHDLHMVLSGSSTVTRSVSVSFEEMMRDLKKIDWESPEKRSKAITKIVDNVKKTQEEVDKYFDAMDVNIKEVLVSISDPKQRQKVSEALYLFRDEQRTKVQGDMQRNIDLLFGAIETDILGNISTVTQSAAADWEGMTDVEKMMSPINKENKVRGAANMYRNEIVDPIQKELAAMLKEMGFDTGVSFESAMDAAIDHGLLWTPDYDKYIQQFGNSLSGTIIDGSQKWTNPVSDAFFEMGGAWQGSLIDGTFQDISTKLDAEIDKIKAGPSGKKPSISIEVDAKTKELMEQIAREFNSKKFQIQTELKIENPTIKSNLNGAIKTIGKVQALPYAEGGYPIPGELFIAREKGPELVGTIGGKTAVANNDQIVDAVSAGVARAVSKVQGNGGSINLTVKIGEDTVTQKVISGVNRQSVIDGETVIRV